MTWNEWIRRSWPDLAAGRTVEVWGGLPHPSNAGFHALDFALPSGQCADWSVSLTDGGRLHIHEYASGRLLGHRDRFDPDAGISSMVAHLMKETPVGPVLGVIGGMLIIRWFLES